MSLPFFYKEDLNSSSSDVLLDEATSKHIAQVLRMQNSEQLQLTNGKGILFTAEITDNNRKRCTVKITQQSKIAHLKSQIAIAISLIKNANRFEWFLEKATEIGVTAIIPLICSRTEKQYFRQERMQGILISAMLQSQQTWLPVLHAPTKFNDVIKQATQQQKMIAHCEEGKSKVQLGNQLVNPSTAQLILIGPEGDFTPEEIDQALQNNFIAVALGNTRLRTETAGVVAAALLCAK